MGSSHFHVLVLLFSVSMVLGQLGASSGYPRSYISWDDLKVDQEVADLNSGSGYDGRRVIVVDKNGRGHSETLQRAVDMVPINNKYRVKILIRPGIYREKVHVPSCKPFISFIGDPKQSSGTIITWHNKASDRDSEGGELGTYRTATVAVESDYFCASGITIQNTVVATPGSLGMQAVALRISGDRAVFYSVQILGTQDTLLDESGSHYFYLCHIQGSIDFIFGNSKSLYQSCSLTSTAEYAGAIAAHHRNSPNEDTGFSFVNCTISGSGSVYLGRAWGTYSRIIYSYCHMHDIIIPTGWTEWNHPERKRTVEFGEYRCRGKGANRRGRVPWSKALRYEGVRPFITKQFINKENWLRL